MAQNVRSGRPYMSIGEVLAALQPDFPDVSVSKIRFLESEGLIRPERTASGYRKFYAKDLDRLRFVLKLQRDSYLPLKIIRQRLAEYEAGTAPQDASSAETARAAPAVPAAEPQPQPPIVREIVRDPEDDLVVAPPRLHLTESDLADQAGLELGQVRALREFGVICEHATNGTTFFDAEDLVVGKLAHDFMKLGLDARHLKTLRRFADQEAAMFEQLVAPGLRNRKPEMRQQASETVLELAKLARKLRLTYMRQALRDALDGDR